MKQVEKVKLLRQEILSAKGMMEDEDYAKNVNELLDKILGGTQ